MRTKIIAGNWKMNKDLNESSELINGLKSKLAALPNGVKAIVCPPFISLALAKELLKGSPVELGAQNMYPEDAADTQDHEFDPPAHDADGRAESFFQIDADQHEARQQQQEEIKSNDAQVQMTRTVFGLGRDD